jgi:hypothetical protein
MVQSSIDATFKDSPFEYDRLASNPRLQLWTIRVPAEVSTRYLAGIVWLTQPVQAFTFDIFEVQSAFWFAPSFGLSHT